MKYFSLIKHGSINTASKRKVIPAAEFSELVAGAEVLHAVHKDAEEFKRSIVQECELLKEQANLAGFQEGLQQWANELRALEEEKVKIRKEVEQSLVPLSLAAVKKIIGRELEVDPKTLVDIIATALKAVSQHRKITLFVAPSAVELLEAQRPRLKALFEHLESLVISPRADITAGCIIQTEIGILKVQLDDLLQALESAFRSFFDQRAQGGS